MSDTTREEPRQDRAEPVDAEPSENSSGRKKPPKGTIQLAVQEKLDRILDLTAGGANIRQISEKLTEEGIAGCSRSNVHKLLKRAINVGLERLGLKSREYILLELHKESQKELAIMPNLLRLLKQDSETIIATGKSSNADAIEKYSRALERITNRRDALLGLKKQQVALTDADGGPVQIETRVILPQIVEDDGSENFGAEKL